MHGPMEEQESEDGDAPFVEMDPSRRYGRYNKVLGKGAFKTVYPCHIEYLMGMVRISSLVFFHFFFVWVVYLEVLNAVFSYWAFDELEGMEVAWNQVKVRDVLQQSETLERMYAEVHLLKTLKHKNILKFCNSWVDTKNNNINFITEIFTSGTLRQYRRRHKRVDMKAVKNWSRQILRGLLYLHSHDPPIIHRDLKCDNIFVNGSQGEVKIGDLGLAVILRQAHAAHSVIGTPEFMAPELYEEEYNELVDIYSFGMCLLEMVTFEYPYSECANAAQIYKKVSSGIKPAALDKVKDPEVRQFVEKCIATVSRRLPARELLMDPFLQIEGNSETMDFVPYPSLHHSCRDDTHELKTISEEPRVGSNTSKGNSVLNCSLPDTINLKREEVPKLPLHSNAVMGSFSQPKTVEMVNHHCLDNCLEADIVSPRGEQECMRGCRDFQVKGKRKDGNTIFLRLRIADSRGLVRNIHFPFDIDFDTALCVASEMVAELDLSDQDVTAIADMIDVEIEALVPEWKPGLAFEDTSDCCNNSSVGGYSSDIPSDGDHASGAFVFERLPSGRMYWSQSPMVSADEGPAKPGPMNAPSKFEGLLHGRFEELTRRQSGSSSAPDQNDEINFSSESDCQVEDAGDLNTADHSASLTYSGKAVVNPKTPIIYQDKEHFPSKVVKSTAEAEVRSHPSNLQIPTRRKSPEDSGGVYGLNQPEFAGQHKAMCENQHGAALWEEADNGTNPPLEGDRRIAQELENLALQQQHELEVLKRRHQQALEDLKNQLSQRGCTVNPSKNSLSTTLKTQYKFPINCSASVSSENKSERLSLNEIAAVSARINEINGEGVSSASTLDCGLAGPFQEIHQTNFCESNVPNHDFGMQALPQKNRSISSSRLGASINVKAQEKLPHDSQDDRSTQQLSGARPKFDGYTENSTPFLSEMNAAARDGLSTKPLDVEMGVRDGTDERIKEPSEQVKPRRHIVDANSLETVSLEEGHSMKSILCKETGNAAVFKDVNGETGKTGSKFGLAGRDEANGLCAASLEQKTSSKQPRQLFSVKSGGPLDCLSLADSALNMETNHLKLNASAARKCSKQDAMELPCELAGNAFKASVKSCTNSSCDVGKLRKRLSYIGFYKAGVSLKDKSSSFQGNAKPSDQGSTGDLSSNPSKPKSTDEGLEQLKKQQLQKSIAEFEAKTLEGLGRSKSSYLVSSSVKKQSTSGSHCGRFRPNDSTTMR